jgi:hypothetical protein
MFNDSILHNLKYGKLDANMAEVEAAAEAAQVRTTNFNRLLQLIDHICHQFEVLLSRLRCTVAVTHVLSCSSTTQSRCSATFDSDASLLCVTLVRAELHT